MPSWRDSRGKSFRLNPVNKILVWHISPGTVKRSGPEAPSFVFVLGTCYAHTLTHQQSKVVRTRSGGFPGVQAIGIDVWVVSLSHMVSKEASPWSCALVMRMIDKSSHVG